MNWIDQTPLKGEVIPAPHPLQSSPNLPTGGRYKQNYNIHMKKWSDDKNSPEMNELERDLIAVQFLSKSYE